MKRGLKLKATGQTAMAELQVEDRTPMKRGLKHQTLEIVGYESPVEDRTPLKRGLKRSTDHR